ncbi:hypothetical protein K443DRAFT_160815 [Laccaria amethystina LaAM-08-1]|uniref:Uncharacterized protein n=1 Tax=Laccaria amethystina LaAM-08-1 TaxID=1095629 RepID=A0A0C9XUU5_9AGAR|nr:hypothetical protein K443DRAFT_160815 [Laccaria amethystina LaAM-08-1]
MITFIGYPIRIPRRSQRLGLEILRGRSIIHQIQFKKILILPRNQASSTTHPNQPFQWKLLSRLSSTDNSNLALSWQKPKVICSRQGKR